MLNFLLSLGAWCWLILAVVLFALETIIPGAHLLWFGLAAIGTGLFGLLTGMPWQWQLVTFAILSVAAMLQARRYAVTGARSDIPGLNQPGTQYMGRIVTVEEAIRGGRGKVRVGDTLWIAEGPEQPAGSRVRIKGVNGTVLLVERE